MFLRFSEKNFSENFIEKEATGCIKLYVLGDCPSNQTNKSNQIIRTNKKRMTQAAKLAMEAQAKKEQLLELVEKIQKDMKNAEPTRGCREKK